MTVWSEERKTEKGRGGRRTRREGKRRGERPSWRGKRRWNNLHQHKGHNQFIVLFHLCPNPMRRVSFFLFLKQGNWASERLGNMTSWFHSGYFYSRPQILNYSYFPSNVGHIEEGISPNFQHWAQMSETRNQTGRPRSAGGIPSPTIKATQEWGKDMIGRKQS